MASCLKMAGSTLASALHNYWRPWRRRQSAYVFVVMRRSLLRVCVQEYMRWLRVPPRSMATIMLRPPLSPLPNNSNGLVYFLAEIQSSPRVILENLSRWKNRSCADGAMRARGGLPQVRRALWTILSVWEKKVGMDVSESRRRGSKWLTEISAEDFEMTRPRSRDIVQLVYCGDAGGSSSLPLSREQVVARIRTGLDECQAQEIMKEYPAIQRSLAIRKDFEDRARAVVAAAAPHDIRVANEQAVSFLNELPLFPVDCSLPGRDLFDGDRDVEMDGSGAPPAKEEIEFLKRHLFETKEISLLGTTSSSSCRSGAHRVVLLSGGGGGSPARRLIAPPAGLATLAFAL